MTVRLFPGFTLGGANIFSASLDDFEGPIAQIQILTGSYFLPFSGTVEGRHYKSFLQVLSENFTSASDITSDDQIYEFRYDSDSNRIIILKDDIEFTIETANQFTQKILGWTTTDIYEPEDSITGSVQPSHVWVSSYQQLAEPETSFYEDGSVFADSVSDDGRAYSIGRSGVVVLRDFIITTEPMANIHRTPETQGWSFRDFMENTRSVHPFGYVTSSNTGTITASDVTNFYRIRGEEAAFRPRRTMMNLNSYWDHSLNCRHVSASY